MWLWTTVSHLYRRHSVFVTRSLFRGWRTSSVSSTMCSTTPAKYARTHSCSGTYHNFLFSLIMRTALIYTWVDFSLFFLQSFAFLKSCTEYTRGNLVHTDHHFPLCCCSLPLHLLWIAVYHLFHPVCWGNLLILYLNPFTSRFSSRLMLYFTTTSI